MIFGLLLHPLAATNFKRLNIDTLTCNFPSLKDKILLNKMGKGIGITHMEEAFSAM
jgi:hypothetical protein